MDRPLADPGDRPPHWGSSAVPVRAPHLIALAGYHVLILLDAALLVTGRFPLPAYLGAGLIAAGVAVDLAFIGWSAGLVLRAAERGAGTGRLPQGTPTDRVYLCVRCAWTGRARPWSCPRCGGVTVAVGRRGARTMEPVDANV